MNGTYWYGGGSAIRNGWKWARQLDPQILQLKGKFARGKVSNVGNSIRNAEYVDCTAVAYGSGKFWANETVKVQYKA